MTVAPEAVQLPTPTPTVTEVGKSPSRLFWERFRKDKAAIFGGVVVILLIGVAIAGGPIASRLTGHSLNEIVPNSQDDFGIPYGPRSGLWLGADASGHDLFVRVMYGARTSLIVGLLATLLAVAIGTVVGLMTGYFGGWVDTLGSRTADVLLAVPQLLIAVGMVAACSVS